MPDREPADTSAPPGYQELSDFDRRLVEILRADGRRSFRQIAKDLSVTEKRVRRHLARLVDENVFEITTITPPLVLGYTGVASIGIVVEPSASLPKIRAALVDHPMIDYMAVVAGRFQIFIEVYTRDHAELQVFLDEHLGPIEGIRSYEVYPYLDLFYQEGLSPDNKRSLGAEDLTALSPTDFRIIEKLTVDGRKPLSLLARELKTSEPKVRRRVKELIDSGVVRITAVVNPMRFGAMTAAWLSIRLQPQASARDAAADLARLPNVTYVAISAGSADLMIEVVCDGIETFAAVMDEQIRAQPTIQSLEAFLYLDLHYKRPRYLSASASR